MAKCKDKFRSFWYDGYKIEYSRMQKRWFVCDWDYEDGLRDIGPSHPSKYKAMDWCNSNNLGEA